MKKEKPKLSSFLCFALYSTHHAMNRVYKPLLAEFGLTYTQFLVLVSLWEKDNQLVSDIGSTLFLESSTLSPLIKRLETMGYIERKRDIEDERKVRVKLSKSGKKLQTSTGCIADGISQAAGMKPKAVEELTKNILSLRDNLISHTESNSKAS